MIVAQVAFADNFKEREIKREGGAMDTFDDAKRSKNEYEYDGGC